VTAGNLNATATGALTAGQLVASAATLSGASLALTTTQVTNTAGLTATAGNASLGNVTAGTLNATATGALTAGQLVAGAATLSGGSLALTTTQVTNTASLTATAGDGSLGNVTAGTLNATATGSLTAGTVVADAATLSAGDEIRLSSGDITNGAKLTAGGAAQIGTLRAGSIDIVSRSMVFDLLKSRANSIVIHVDDDVTGTSVEAATSLSMSAGGQLKVDQTKAQSVTMDADAANLGRVLADQNIAVSTRADLRALETNSANGVVDLRSSEGNVVVKLAAGDGVGLRAALGIIAETVEAGTSVDLFGKAIAVRSLTERAGSGPLVAAIGGPVGSNERAGDVSINHSTSTGRTLRVSSLTGDRVTITSDAARLDLDRVDLGQVMVLTGRTILPTAYGADYTIVPVGPYVGRYYSGQPFYTRITASTVDTDAKPLAPNYTSFVNFSSPSVRPPAPFDTQNIGVFLTQGQLTNARQSGVSAPGFVALEQLYSNPNAVRILFDDFRARLRVVAGPSGPEIQIGE
jgi:hypothetical protein